MLGRRLIGTRNSAAKGPAVISSPSLGLMGGPAGPALHSRKLPLAGRGGLGALQGLVAEFRHDGAGPTTASIGRLARLFTPARRRKGGPSPGLTGLGAKKQIGGRRPRRAGGAGLAEGALRDGRHPHAGLFPDNAFHGGGGPGNLTGPLIDFYSPCTDIAGLRGTSRGRRPQKRLGASSERRRAELNLTRGGRAWWPAFYQ